LKHFAADQRDKASAAKRGSGLQPAELDDEMTDFAAEKPDAEFDRQWALTVLARALGRLEAEMVSDGKKAHFDALKPWLTAEADSTPQTVAAEKLGLSVEAVKVAVHRLRKRFREAVKAEIAQTVSDSSDVREELDALMAALRSR
jgi:RNA polymerase sigma-70 factor (ECF subfamily)